ncbi:MAG: DUF2007 domain-containing protein [Dehalococcoidia bacterium]|nr:DUF2007 domain-containing protein [Dehalococcoidia bacterium]MDD5493768.1 DUF2007 domain-containing protein [Dehalococcoidia bacterium]
MKSEHNKLVTIYKAMGQPEAEIVRGRLEVAGIPSVLKYESLGTVYGLTIDGLGQVEVQVPLAFEEAARQLLASTPGEPEE